MEPWNHRINKSSFGDGNEMSSKREIHMMSCFFHFLARSWPLWLLEDLSVSQGPFFSVEWARRITRSQPRSECLSLPFSLYRGRKKRGPGTRLRTLSRKLIQIRTWGFWKLGNGLFPKWPLPADEVRDLSQSTLNAPLLNEQKPVKHVVAFKAIPTSGHITQCFRCGPSRWWY